MSLICSKVFIFLNFKLLFIHFLRYKDKTLF
nr:MAG TPA: hypothetical protein [Caudoviricetes sp.]